MKSVNQRRPPIPDRERRRSATCVPSRAERRPRGLPVLRGTLVGSLCSCVPGTGPTIASFVAYALEKRVSRRRTGSAIGAIEGVAAPEAATHAATQGDFIPTMSLGIPGNSAMALLLGALVLHG